jgi:diacylglycerol O-acyltransferase
VQQLTGLDAAFLAMETNAVFGHVGSVIVLDPSTSPEELTLERLQTLIERRLHLIPPFRRRLAEVPFGLDQPYWIEDPDFDIDYHVREIALPAPGNERQLTYQASRLHGRALDRSRPLWELYLIHGLEGDRKAIYTKVHHAAIDGVSGNDILAAVLDLSSEGRPEEEPPQWHCDQVPSSAMLLAKSVVSLAGHPLRAARMSYGLAKSLPGLAISPARPRLPVIDRLLGRDAKAVLNNAPLRAPRTPFNRPISPHRRWSYVSLSLEDVKEVKNAAGCTVNDVVMALTAGALRRWLLDHDALPSSALVAAVPVSVRSDEEKGKGGNRVSTMMAPLPTHLDDPKERIAACSAAMRAAKEQFGALPADLLGDVTQFAMPALAGQAARAAARLRVVERVNPFNLIVSNVPGPAVDLYYGGCKVLAYYPLSAIADGQGLNITVCSLAGGMHFGLIADRELVPDVDRMAQYLADELQTLQDACLQGASEPVAGDAAAQYPSARS